MKASRELDAEIAMKVMGWESPDLGSGWGAAIVYGSNPEVYDPPPYSTDISAAWKVVEKLSHRNFSMHNDVGRSGSSETPGTGWMCLFHVEGSTMAYSIGESAPYAICLAALATVSGAD